MNICKVNSDKKLRLTNYKLIILSINICLILIVELFKIIALNSSIDLYIQYKFVFIIALLIYTYIILSAYNIQKKVDPYIIFISISFFFFYGQHALIFLNVQRQDITILMGRLQEYYLIKTGYIILQFILCSYIGYMLVYSNKSNTPISKERNLSLEDKSLFQTACIFFTISVIPTILYLMTNIKMTLTKGYSYRIVENTNQIESGGDIFLLLSRFMLPSLIAMYIACKKKDEKKVTFLIALYLILYIISGSRINAFCSLSIIIFIAIKKKNNILKKNILKYIVVILIVTFVFTIISDVRSSISIGGDIVNELSKSIKNIWNNNFIFAAFRETGYTFEVTACVFQNCPSVIPHINGISYFSSIVYIFPNFLTNGFISKYQFVDSAFSPFLSSYGGIGSSFIAETYYNFGGFTFVFMIIIGMIWGLLNNKIEISLNKNSAITYFNCVYLFQLFIFTVRSDMVYNFRVFVWYVLPISVVAYTVKNSRKSSKHRYNI